MDLLVIWARSIRRHVVLTFAPVVIIVALTVLVILYFPRTYRSRSQLLLRVGHENATIDPTVEAAGQMVNLQVTRKNDIETALQVMHSRSVLAEVVDRLGSELILQGDRAANQTSAVTEQATDSAPGWLSQLKNSAGAAIASIDPITDRERAIRELGSHLEVFATSEASVVDAEYRAKSPTLAQQILATWLNCYLGKHAELHRTSGAHQFFLAEEDEMRTKLEQAYADLRAAKTESELVTVSGHQKLLENQLAQVRQSLSQTETLLAGSQARSEILLASLSKTENRTVTDEVKGKANEARDEMRGRLFELEVLEREFAAKYKSDHPRLITIRSQLAEAQQIVDQQDEGRAEITSGINPVFQQLQQELLMEKAAEAGHQRQRETLLAQVKQLQSEMADLNTTEQHISFLDRRVDVLQRQYAEHSKRLDQARIDEALRQRRITSVNVIQNASLEERPISPKKSLVAALGMFASFATILGLPLLLAGWDETKQASEPLTDLPACPPINATGSSNRADEEEARLDSMFQDTTPQPSGAASHDNEDPAKRLAK
ncbi:GumC family protein [Roseiconus lacunae]|uniref:GumC family protein n=1 Tax=Roseiconus lacunae TaxID=2605694 RepID=UPI001E5CFE55|nr:hypothetical protein [Roseiconus lacunae]MCD0463156.1 hypothetical protein [Roseiconus lacunae]